MQQTLKENLKEAIEKPSPGGGVGRGGMGGMERGGCSCGLPATAMTAKASRPVSSRGANEASANTRRIGPRGASACSSARATCAAGKNRASKSNFAQANPPLDDADEDDDAAPCLTKLSPSCAVEAPWKERDLLMEAWLATAMLAAGE